MNTLHLARIMQFADSTLPVGGFSFSNGVETAIQSGVVHDTATLSDFTRSVLWQAATGDGRAINAACQALQRGDLEALMVCDRAVNNRRLNEEGRMMVTRMGKKLAEMAVSIINEPQIAQWLELIKTGQTIGTYPVTQAIVMTALGIPTREIIAMQQHSLAMTLLSAAVRLMRITHVDTQRILFEVNQEMELFCDAALQGEIEQMATYSPVTDILASLHVKAFTRLFSN